MTEIAQKKPRTLNDFQLEEIDGEVLLYSPSATRSIYLNPSAALIWHLCSGDHTVDEIIESLREHFPEQADSISEDVTATLEKFLESQAIELL